MNTDLKQINKSKKNIRQNSPNKKLIERLV